jgi:hypothetical protein
MKRIMPDEYTAHVTFENTIIYLIGFAGVGKYTIAQHLAAIEPFKIVDNHYILNPIFNLLEQDGVTPLPPKVWDRAMQVRLAVLATIGDLSPTRWNFAFTNELLGDASSQELYSQVLEVAKARGSRFVPVRLVCDIEEHVRRVTRPERRERMKSVDARDARTKHDFELFQPRHPHTLTLEVTHLSAEESAWRILEHVCNIGSSSGVTQTGDG